MMYLILKERHYSNIDNAYDIVASSTDIDTINDKLKGYQLINDDKQNSYFFNQYNFKRHFPFSIINENLDIPNISFNNTCTIKIPIKGTVVNSVYLRVLLPSVEEYDLIYHEDVEYRLIEEDKSNDMVSRAFPFAKLVEKEHKIEELVKGTIIGIYYEQRGGNVVTERQWLDKSEPLDQDTIDYIVSLAKRVCVNMVYDEILKPPTIDEQVEDFIKEFFEEGDSEPLEQKDFLADFFKEIEEEK